MHVLRLVVPSNHTYLIKQIGDAVGFQFDDRQVVDVPLRTPEQKNAADAFCKDMADGLGTKLRNGPNAVIVYSAEVVEIR